ncbi:uncharacterized protein N7515_001040 [Penicillium bovifimosum]|uniref:Uncharacterized protein n=1 Tax=Penicillium bovifimosum TaxID=126998 RepID=A0A9W9HGU8_9EURO|nr:uncharacterized protein N7515_001040 [Penicillium bovifimosum]KAJ5146476.1 hypothetical protein N7515_001040 [Penicillium bovifimosum]
MVHYFTSSDEDALRFHRNIQALNLALSYTTIRCTFDERLPSHERHWIFQIRGALYHVLGPLSGASAMTGQLARAAQVYFLGEGPEQASELATNARSDSNPHLMSCRDILEKLGGRQYDLPSVNAEVAALIIPSEFGQRGYRDIQLYLREAPSLTRATDLISVDGDNSDSDMIENLAQVTPATQEIDSDEDDWEDDVLDHDIDQDHGEVPDGLVAPHDPAIDEEFDNMRQRFLTRIHREHPLYMPLSYVVLYTSGGRGFYRSIPLPAANPKTGRAFQRSKVSMVEFLRLGVYTRRHSINRFHRAGVLFQQCLVDGWIAAEGKKLEYIRWHQDEIRRYDMSREEDIIKLPSSMTGLS